MVVCKTMADIRSLGLTSVYPMRVRYLSSSLRLLTRSPDLVHAESFSARIEKIFSEILGMIEAISGQQNSEWHEVGDMASIRKLLVNCTHEMSVDYRSFSIMSTPLYRPSTLSIKASNALSFVPSCMRSSGRYFGGKTKRSRTSVWGRYGRSFSTR